MALCHPEPKAKDLATEWEVSLFRNPDPSLRYAPFKMTNGGAKTNPNLCHWGVVTRMVTVLSSAS